MTERSLLSVSVQQINLENVDWEKPCRVKVQDFAVYGGRLQEIDWMLHKDQPQNWEDPHFRPEISSLLDSSITN